MEAIINIGEENICVSCGKLNITASMDEDNLPLCSKCTIGHSRRKLFREWRLLGERVKLLGNIVQNPLEDVSYENYREFWQLSHIIRKELVKYIDATNQCVWDNCSDRWAENGEMDK